MLAYLCMLEQSGGAKGGLVEEGESKICRKEGSRETLAVSRVKDGGRLTLGRKL